MEKLYVQYGCGLSAPEKWKNFDTSPTLRIQKTPVIGSLIKGRLNAVFPNNVLYGDIVKGLPLKDNSCDAVYCSHVLEHLALNDFRMALSNTYKILKPGGTFRLVLPDLEIIAKSYLESLKTKPETASIDFCGNGSLMGVSDRSKGLKGLLTSHFGNAHHLWMWDNYSMTAELKKAGFKDIHKVVFNDNPDEMFKLVEDKDRFENAVALECYK